MLIAIDTHAAVFAILGGKYFLFQGNAGEKNLPQNGRSWNFVCVFV
jgi:hypothetical protein